MIRTTLEIVVWVIAVLVFGTGCMKRRLLVMISRYIDPETGEEICVADMAQLTGYDEVVKNAHAESLARLLAELFKEAMRDEEACLDSLKEAKQFVRDILD